jgi:flagellar hook-associated protein 1 FlgK
MRKDNLVKDAVKGVNLKLAGLGEAEVYVNNIAGDGELYALMESRDEVIPKYQEMLFNFMKTFTDSFNAVHFNGYNTQGGTHVNFFNTMPETLGETNSTDALLNFSVNEALIKDSTLLATATVDEEYFAETGVLRSKGVGDNSNALKMASLRFESIFADNSNVLDKYGQIFTTLGIDSQSTKATKFTQEQINLNLSNQKEQISGVSLDEEMTNLVRYQHGYSASARMISTIDGMLEVLINQVGR